MAPAPGPVQTSVVKEADVVGSLSAHLTLGKTPLFTNEMHNRCFGDFSVLQSPAHGNDIASVRTPQVFGKERLIVISAAIGHVFPIGERAFGV